MNIWRFRSAPIVALVSSTITQSALGQQALPTINIGAATHGVGQTHSAPTGTRSSHVNGTGDVSSTAGGDGEGGGAYYEKGSYACAKGVCNDPKAYAAPIQSLATKVNTPVMETPLAVKTVTRQMLEDQQVTSLDQALRNVSGVSFNGGGAIGIGTPFAGLSIRGFGTSAYYRDGVRVDNYAGTTGINNIEFGNVDSVEVLKGPAAILYGAVEPGGIVNINLKQPSATPSFAVQQQIGNYSSYRSVIEATGPLTEDKSVRYRFTGSYEDNGSFRRDGYYKNLMLNPVVQWNIDGSTSVKLETQYLQNRLSQVYDVIPFYNVFSDNVTPGFVPIWFGRKFTWGPVSPLSQTSTFSQLTLRHDFDSNWSIKQSTFLQTSNLTAAVLNPNSIADCITPGADPFGGCGSPGAPLGAVSQLIAQNSFPGRQKQFATVVDLTGKLKTGELAHTLLIGADYYRYNSRNALIQAFQQGAYSILGAPQPFGFPSQLYPFSANEQQSDNVGAYVQDQIDLPFNLHILGGARYQYISARSQATEFGSACGPFFGDGTTPCDFNNLTAKGRDTNQRVTPRIGLLWRPYEWISLYGNYVESYSPNFSGLFLVNQPGKTTPPSAGQQTEAGIKLELLDKKLFVTASYYHLTKTNIPLARPDGITADLIGEARAQGPELDIQGEILPGWSVNLTYANTDVIVTKSNGASGFPVGAPIYNVPRNQGSIASTYEFRDGGIKGLKFGARYDYTGYLPFYHADFSGNYIAGQSTPSYGLVGLLASYEFNYDRFKVHAQLNIDNLLDESYFRLGGLGWFPGYFPGCCAPSTLPGFGTANGSDNVFGSPRIIRGAIRVSF